MDVTFTNVLEGARQYFQGLPAGTGSTASPSSTVSYAGGGVDTIPVSAAQENLMSAPNTSRPSSQQQHQQQQQQQHQQQQQQQQQPQQYHYTAQNYPQYPTATHHESVLQYSYPRSTTSYHQLQPPRHQPSTSYAYPPQQQQPPKPYYPPATPHSQAYSTPAASQAQPQQQPYHGHQFTSHSYSPHTHTYLPSNPSTSKPSEHLQTPQHHRTTHNLPPIAALSSVNYHSNKSNREPVRLSSHRQRIPITTATSATVTIPSTISVNASTSQSQRILQYSQSSSHYDTSSQSSTNGPTYSYPPTSSQAYTCTTTTTPNFSSTTSSTSSAYSQSSYSQHFQKVTPKSNQYQSTSSKDYLYQSASSLRTNSEQTPASITVTNHSQTRTETHPATSILTAKQKRESPLDLSVKTVRTSADSTALDDAEIHSSDQRVKAYLSNRSMPPPMQVPSNVQYAYDQRNSVRTSTASTGAPKVDFLPNFNVSSLHHTQRTHNTENNRQIIQQADKNHNTSRNMSYNNKVYYQQQSSYHHQASYPQYNNNVMPNTAHPNAYSAAQVPPKRPAEQGLPRIDFPTPGHTKGTVYATSARDIQRKRSAESVSAVPNKVPKMETWRQTIDQQIEQKISSYANSKKHLEQHQQIQYTQNQSQHHVIQQQKPVNNVKQVVNGNMMPNHHRYATYSQSHSSYPAQQPFNNNSQYHSQQIHNQTYVPTAMSQHHYPPHANMHSHSQTTDMYQQNVLHRTNSNPKLVPTSPVRNNNLGGADKRVLSILRNSLEIKGAKEAQKKLEQVQVKPQEIHANHMRSSGVQQPSTDVTAPLQPKPGIVGRQNVSPFPAANLLERNSNTPPIYKFHFPRAVDSVRFETETITKDNPVQTHTTKQDIYEDNTVQNISNAPTGASSGTSDLDGLAAFLAARIRTKAELKQVSSNQNMSNAPVENATANADKATVDAAAPVAAATNNVAPKFIKDRTLLPPRRRLFSRSEEEQNNGTLAQNNNASSICAPTRDSAIRSSSETSVFDFRDSDSESEMPVLKRESLDDMRRDRKSMIKLQPMTVINENDVRLEETIVELKIEEDAADPFWSETCDKFLEQLKTSGGKKRGRRKKVVEPDVLAKLETVTKENPIDNINLDAVVKLENIDLLSNQDAGSSTLRVKEETEEPKTPKVENDSDSDLPLARRKPTKLEQMNTDGEESSVETKKEKIGAKIKIEYSSDSSDSDSETIQSVSEKLRLKKLKENKENTKQNDDKGMVLRSADNSPKKIKPLVKKKAIFGDGSDFHPGWEEEVYKYKRSLRMPARLINITRAPHWHRMSTSLPDLNPCSPAASFLTDDTEFSTHINRRSMPNHFVETSNTSKTKRDILDSDMDSNSSFTFNYQKSYDSEEASCSSLKSATAKKEVKNKENNNILDVLVERYSKFKRKKTKGKEQKIGPKIIPKSTNPLELLPTPSLGIGSPEKEPAKPRGRPKLKKDDDVNKVEMNNSVYLGFFRKETVNNFRDTFKKNSGFMGMGEQFSTVVLKSRTRTETRVMKQRATIREVFGEERPASAPPIACREDDNMESSQDSIISEHKSETKPQLQATAKLKKDNNMSPTRTGLRSASGRRPNKLLLNKKLQRGRKRNNLLKVLATKKIENEEIVPKSETPSIKSETPSVKSETPSVDGDDTSEVSHIPTKKRLKLRNMRRKFSSGFDYIRKKKKQVKKEGTEADGSVKTKRRGILPRPSPESVQDIQREIKTWVMNKGVGETHLHRAARLGYTDVTAYCLEKMDCMPSPKDNAGYTPLHEACSRGHLDIARLLLQYGANVSESAQGGIRPLHEAAENGFVEIVRLLLSYGADPMLATYSGLTPLSLTSEEETKSLLRHYMADMEGLPAPPWSFNGPAVCFDPEDSGFDPLCSAPSPEPVPDDEDIEIEMSEQQLPNLYTLRGEPPGDRWVLLQDLSVILKIKSRDTLLRQINGGPASSSSSSTASMSKSIIKELKFSDFMEQAHCCTLLCANEKLNARSSKIALVKYTDKVKQLLGVDRTVITSR